MVLPTATRRVIAGIMLVTSGIVVGVIASRGAASDGSSEPSSSPEGSAITHERTGAADAETSTPHAPSSCPEGMALVSGSHCEHTDEACLKWMDPPPYHHLRCAEFKAPTRCLTERTAMRFCIDRYERADPGEELPRVNISWTEAKRACEAEGSRLCLEDEWELACEGEEMLPYPYGYARDSSACNFDKTHLGKPETGLVDMRVKPGAYAKCTSPFGVHDMVGNVDEWVERPTAPRGRRSVLRGGWWLPGRNRCRAATTHHVESYRGKQVGYRCCRDPNG